MIETTLHVKVTDTGAVVVEDPEEYRVEPVTLHRSHSAPFVDDEGQSLPLAHIIARAVEIYLDRVEAADERDAAAYEAEQSWIFARLTEL